MKPLNKVSLKLIFNDLYKELCVYAYTFLGKTSLSKDIVQEIFIKVWEDKILFQDRDHIVGYFYKSVRYKCINVLKKKSYVKNINSYEIDDLEDYDTEEFVFLEDICIEPSEVVDQAINQLPTKAGEVIRLSIKDYTNNEIAEKLSISINTVKDHKKVAYKKLRDFFKNKGILSSKRA